AGRGPLVRHRSAREQPYWTAVYPVDEVVDQAVRLVGPPAEVDGSPEHESLGLVEVLSARRRHVVLRHVVSTLAQLLDHGVADLPRRPMLARYCHSDPHCTPPHRDVPSTIPHRGERGPETFGPDPPTFRPE